MHQRVAPRKTALVKFVDDKDVIDNITNIAKKKPAKERKDILYDHSKCNDLPNDSDAESYQPSSALFEEKNDVEGKDCFAVSPFRVRTPKVKKSSKLTKSPGSRLKQKKVADASTSASKNETSGDKTEGKGYRLRHKMRQELESMKLTATESDPEDTDEDESWEDESEEEISPNAEISSTPNGTMPGWKKKNASAFAEDYFFAQKQSKRITSNRTLSKVDLKQTNVEELSKVYKNIPEGHIEEKAFLAKMCHQFHKKWMFLLQEDFNIMLYGVGSKLDILRNFCHMYLEDYLCVVIHGFFPSLSIKQILCTITEDALEDETKFSNIYDHAEYIKNHFLESKEDLYIIIHNIDGSTLRAVKTQSVLGMLAAVPRIHFLASVDHINCSLIWDQIMLSQFRWVWFDVTTFEPYIAETSYENTLLRDQSTQLLLSSLLHVYHSLTPNGRGVFLLLAKHQSDNIENTSYLGIAFKDWYQSCREGFLVNSELTMQAQLSEFKNHKLLALRKSVDGVEHWYIPVDKGTLKQFLEACE